MAGIYFGAQAGELVPINVSSVEVQKQKAGHEARPFIGSPCCLDGSHPQSRIGYLTITFAPTSARL
jgi:hypothetical protein